MEENKTIPINTMMEDIRFFIKELQEVFQIHQDYVTTAIMAAAGTAIGRRLVLIDPKGYENTPALWWCHVAPSGYGKSAAASAIMKPLAAIQQKWRKNYQIACKKWEETGKLEYDRPKERKIFVSDATPEALFSYMEANSGELLLYRDELAGWVKDFGRYNQSGEVELYLSCYSQGAIDMARVKGSGFIEKPHFSVFGGIQPSRLGAIFGSDALVQNGFDARFCWIYPDIVETAKYNKRCLSPISANWWCGFINQLLEMSPKTITMSEEAAKLYIDFWESVKQRIIDSPEGWMKQSLAKMQIMAERVASIYWLLSARNYNERYTIQELDAESMQQAIEMMDLIEQWSKKVELQIWPDGKAINKEDKKDIIRRMDRNGCSQSSIARALGVSQPYVSNVLKGQC